MTATAMHSNVKTHDKNLNRFCLELEANLTGRVDLSIAIYPGLVIRSLVDLVTEALCRGTTVNVPRADAPFTQSVSGFVFTFDD